MAIFAYNLSSNLDAYIKKIERLRQQILLYPIPPKAELRMRWEASLERIYWSLLLLEHPLGKKQMTELLVTPPSKRIDDSKKDVINQKKAFDFIRENWSVNKNPVSASTLKRLYEISAKETLGPAGKQFQSAKRDLEFFLDYLRTGNEHPVIQAGLAQIQIFTLSPFRLANGRISRLAAYLFLYKYGYDFRGLLVLEKYFMSDLVAFKSAVASVKTTKNLTLWLEYFAYGVMLQLEKAYSDILSGKFLTDIPATFWKLNDRQKEILGILEQPGAKITNKEVQKRFGISQITASRDLSKLAQLGLLFSHGKGRSVFYTKV